MASHRKSPRIQAQAIVLGLATLCMGNSAQALTPYQQQQQQEQARQRQQEQRRLQLNAQRQQQQRETLRQQQQMHQNQELVRTQQEHQKKQLEIQRQQLVADQERQVELRKVALRENEARERERLAALRKRAELDRLKKAWNCTGNTNDGTANMPPKTISRAQARSGYTGRSTSYGRVEVRYKGHLITVPAACVSNAPSRSAQSLQAGENSGSGQGVIPQSFMPQTFRQWQSTQGR